MNALWSRILFRARIETYGPRVPGTLSFSAIPWESGLGYRSNWQRAFAGADVNDPSTVKWLISSWREDLIANKGKRLGPGFQALAHYRFGVWCQQQAGVLGWLVNNLYTVAYIFIRIVYGVELPRSAVIGRRLWLPHPVGVIISRQAQIGDDCLIRQNVTIGRFAFGRERTGWSAPKLGNGVMVGPGAVIVGGIKVGDGARIGPNAVIVTDVPAGASAVARPAGILMPQGTKDEVSYGKTSMSDDHVGATKPSANETLVDPIRDDEAVSAFIRFIFDVVDPEEMIEANTPLLSTGIIDSFDVTALLGAIEDTYGVVIDPEEVDVDTFNTPAQMLSRIEADQK